MKKQLLGFLMVFLIIGSGVAFAQSGWTTYSASDYGFSMLIPEGTQMISEEWGGGWGGLYGEHDGVKVFGVAKLGAAESAEDIEAFGVEVTGIPASRWTEIDRGEGDGWKWYRTVKATQGSKLIFGGYGVGPKGNYLLLLETTASDFNEYRSEYEKWYNSIRLH